MPAQDIRARQPRQCSQDPADEVGELINSIIVQLYVWLEAGQCSASKTRTEKRRNTHTGKSACEPSEATGGLFTRATTTATKFCMWCARGRSAPVKNRPSVVSRQAHFTKKYKIKQ